ncbi:uncharacterized protein LOC130928557 isoform X4 [Corythoichthys intestinalis]|uniref:uncharacterized protein LOC130928557 isoform X4 n=1 Tax=Corythoichthys intestinalis TaxID=161448 RepID=UPI0025A54589|nr:uncharacterized protein LOC130928557 isoform X4 [Corythoichthys intestinalis]
MRHDVEDVSGWSSRPIALEKWCFEDNPLSPTTQCNRLKDVSQVHRPERQESPRMEEELPYIKKVGEKFVHIKEEQEEYFIRVVNPYIEEQQQPHSLKKEEEEEDPPYVKVKVVDMPEWTDEPLKGEDGGESEASRGKEPQNGSNSSSKERSQADNLIAQPSESDDFTSHSLFFQTVGWNPNPALIGQYSFRFAICV